MDNMQFFVENNLCICDIFLWAKFDTSKINKNEKQG